MTDFGADNYPARATTARRRSTTCEPEFVGKDTFFHTNCGNNVSVDCVQRYKALEMSVGKRMSNRWQMQGSYVWSRLDGDQQGISTSTTTVRAFYDYTNPNNLLDSVRSGRGAQRPAARLQAARQLPGGVGHHRRRELPGAERPAARSQPHRRALAGLARYPGGSRGTYRADTLNLLSLRADKRFTLHGSRRASFIAEVHNVLNCTPARATTAC